MKTPTEVEALIESLLTFDEEMCCGQNMPYSPDFERVLGEKRRAALSLNPHRTHMAPKDRKSHDYLISLDAFRVTWVEGSDYSGWF